MVRAAARYDVGRAAACACALTLAGAHFAAPALPSLPLLAEAGPQAPLYFNIPAQLLATALERYAVVTDQTVLFSDELVAGRYSYAVNGQYSPREALDILLIGTQLRADRVGQGTEMSFVLRGITDALVPAATEPLDRSYDGLLQRRVWEALCTHQSTAPGQYRAVLLLQVDAGGRLMTPRLVGSTGTATRDQAILAALHGLRLDRAPPATLKQPLALIILPSTAQGSGRCPAVGAGDE